MKNIAGAIVASSLILSSAFAIVHGHEEFSTTAITLAVLFVLFFGWE